MTDPSLLRACQDAPWDMVPRLIYADWLEEHGSPKAARRFRNQYDGKLLHSLLPHVHGYMGPWTRSEPGHGRAVYVGESAPFRDAVIDFMAWRGRIGNSATVAFTNKPIIRKATNERVSITQVAGYATTLIDMRHDRPATWLNYTAPYSTVAAESFAASMMGIVSGELASTD